MMGKQHSNYRTWGKRIIRANPYIIIANRSQNGAALNGISVFVRRIKGIHAALNKLADNRNFWGLFSLPFRTQICRIIIAITP